MNETKDRLTKEALREIQREELIDQLRAQVEELQKDKERLATEREAYARLLLSVEELTAVMETCHICEGTICIDEGPVHCEDCSWDCEEHPKPSCASIEILHANLKREAAAIRARAEPK